MPLRRLRLRHAVLSAVLGIALGSCSSGHSFVVQDLARLTTQPSEAPPGTEYARRLSGSSDLEGFRGDPAGRAAMQAAGFRAAYLALFASPRLLDFFTFARAGEEPPKNGALISSAAVLFDDEGGAGEALDFFQSDLRDQFEGERAIPSAGLGDDAFALQGTQQGGRAAIVYAWRVDNVYLAVVAQGPIDEAVVLGTARAMDSKAEAAAS